MRRHHVRLPIRRTRSRQGSLGTGSCMHKPVSPGSKQSPGQPPKQWRQWRALGICLPPGCWFPIAASERRCRSGGQHVLISGTGSGGCLPPMRRSRGCSADGAVAHPFHQLTQAGTGATGRVLPRTAQITEMKAGQGRVSARSRRRRSSLARAGTSSRGSRRATCRRGRASPRHLRLRRPAATSRSQGG